MKKDIHPKYYPKAKVTCACGNVFFVGATMEKIEVEICSACHPFYTGKEKVVDAAGRVERFKKISAKKQMFKPTSKSVKKNQGKRKQQEQVIKQVRIIKK